MKEFTENVRKAVKKGVVDFALTFRGVWDWRNDNFSCAEKNENKTVTVVQPIGTLEAMPNQVGNVILHGHHHDYHDNACTYLFSDSLFGRKKKERKSK